MLKGHILIIDDEEKLRQLIARILELEGYAIYQAGNSKKAFQVLEQNIDIQLVITDVKLPDDNGIAILEKVKAKYPFCEVIVMTAYGTIQDGVKAMKLGAFDYLTKGDEDEQIVVSAERAVEKAKMQHRIQSLENQVYTKFNFDNILGESKAIKGAISLAQRVATANTSVLLEGETGTGKELFAQAIHQASPRKNKPFVAVNCSAFPKDLLESEMFGHKKGAFTGATFDKKGLFEEANEGTLFLDEIGEMNLDLQAKMLRVLETQSFIKTGETKPTHVDVRIVAATNRNLLQEIEKEHFRSDLYYRLSVFKIEIPPLKSRKEDIEILANYFLNHFSKNIKKHIKNLEKEFLEKLKNYAWKGNIRELKNIMERAVILCDTDTLTVDLLPNEILFAQKETEKEAEKEITSNNKNAEIPLSEIEKKHIIKVLNQTNGNKTEAAKILNIGLTTLYRKIEEYGI